MRPRADSQSGRILALLETGGWWSTSELLREVPSIVHSRIAGLRDAGFVIEHKKTGQGAAHSLYRLDVASGAGTVEPSPASDGAPAADAPAASLPAEEGTSRSVPSEAQPALLAGQNEAATPGSTGGLGTTADAVLGPAESAESQTLFGDERTQYQREEAA